MRSKFIKEFNIPEEGQKFIGSDLDYRKIAFDKFKGEVHCELCGIKEVPMSSGGRRRQGFVVHHKDMRSSTDKYYHIDNRPDNLLVLCPSCHSTMHQRGKVVSEETRRRMSESGRVKTFSEEHRRRIRESSRSRTHSEDTRKRLSEVHRGKTFSEEHRRNLGKVSKGKKWYNDGIRSYRLDPSDKRCKDLNEGRIYRRNQNK